MKKVLSLVVALGVAALFSSATLAGAECNYHKTQAAADQAPASKEVATAPVSSDKTETVKTAEAATPTAQPASPTKK